MTTDQQIAALLARAEPLRLLPEEEAEAQGLPELVEQINALRNPPALSRIRLEEVDPQAEAIKAALPVELPKRRPGRPKVTHD